MQTVVVYHNLSDQAVLSGGSWQATLPLTNLQDNDIGVVARSTNALLASTQFNINFGATRPLGGIVLGPTNMTPGSSYRMRAYEEAAQTTLVFDTGIKVLAGSSIDWSNTGEWLEWEDPGFWYGIADSTDLFDDYPVYLSEVFPTVVNAHSWRIEIMDDGNLNGFVQFGRLLAGRSYKPSQGYDSQDNAFGPEPITDVLQSLGGMRTYWERGLPRSLRIAFSIMPESEGLNDVFRMATRARTSRQVFIIPDLDDPGRARERWFLATFRQAPAIAHIQLADRRTAFVLDFEEVL